MRVMWQCPKDVISHTPPTIRQPLLKKTKLSISGVLWAYSASCSFFVLFQDHVLLISLHSIRHPSSVTPADMICADDLLFSVCP